MAYARAGAVRITTRRREDEDGPLVGAGTTIDYEGFPELSSCCRRATIHIEPGKAVTADLELFCTFRGEADVLRFHMKHPVTGALERVKRIEFADGTVLEEQPRLLTALDLVAAVNGVSK